MNTMPWEGTVLYIWYIHTFNLFLFLFFSAGVDVYVLDTGVFAEHLDFEGRATYSANFIKTESDVDMGGHGKGNNWKQTSLY
jgi:hypothetical protein